MSCPGVAPGTSDEALALSTTTLPDQMEPSRAVAGMAMAWSVQVRRSGEVVWPQCLTMSPFTASESAVRQY